LVSCDIDGETYVACAAQQQQSTLGASTIPRQLGVAIDRVT
jgi:hypothetical protein